MSDYRFTILIRQYLFLHYFRTNTTLYRIGTWQILYQGPFIKVDQCFCKPRERREEYCTICFKFQGRSFLIACQILYRGPYLGNKGNHQTINYQKSRKKGPFPLLWELLNKKAAFSLHFKQGYFEK